MTSSCKISIVFLLLFGLTIQVPLSDVPEEPEEDQPVPKPEPDVDVKEEQDTSQTSFYFAIGVIIVWCLILIIASILLFVRHFCG